MTALRGAALAALVCAAVVCQTVVFRQVAIGGVVLLHCIQSQSAALVDAVVPKLLDDGFKFVRLDDVPVYRKYEAPATGAAVALAAPDARKHVAAN